MVSKEDQDSNRVNRLVFGWKQGNESDKEELVRVLRPIVISFVKNASKGYPGQWEDLEQTAWEGVFNAVQTFDETQGVKFWTWATWQMRKHVSIWRAANSGSISLPYPAWQAAGRVDSYLISHDLTREQVSHETLQEVSGASNVLEILSARDGNFGLDVSEEKHPTFVIDDDVMLLDFERLLDMFDSASEDTVFGAALDLCDDYELDYEIADKVLEEYRAYSS